MRHACAQTRRALDKASGKQTGACVLYDDEPERLVDRLIHYYRTDHVRKPSCFCDARPDGAVAP